MALPWLGARILASIAERTARAIAFTRQHAVGARGGHYVLSSERDRTSTVSRLARSRLGTRLALWSVRCSECSGARSSFCSSGSCSLSRPHDRRGAAGYSRPDLSRQAPRGRASFDGTKVPMAYVVSLRYDREWRARRDSNPDHLIRSQTNLRIPGDSEGNTPKAPGQVHGSADKMRWRPAPQSPLGWLPRSNHLVVWICPRRDRYMRPSAPESRSLQVPPSARQAQPLRPGR